MGHTSADFGTPSCRPPPPFYRHLLLFCTAVKLLLSRKRRIQPFDPVPSARLTQLPRLGDLALPFYLYIASSSCFFTSSILLPLVTLLYECSDGGC